MFRFYDPIDKSTFLINFHLCCKLLLTSDAEMFLNFLVDFLNQIFYKFIRHQPVANENQFHLFYFLTFLQFLSSKEIEREYWRILSCLEEPISVEYGADLQTHEHGSGFPTHKLLERVPEEKAVSSDCCNFWHG